MEWRVNAILLIVLACVWGGLTAAQPIPAIHASVQEPGLARLEDAFAHDRGDVHLARQLARAYLELERPGLTIATLRAANPELLEHPVLAHRLSQAYERSGRLLDALATAELAAARCERDVGSRPASTPVPRFRCSAREMAVLEMHRTALDHMTNWGVSRPDQDPRRQLAYDLAMRRARVAVAR